MGIDKSSKGEYVKISQLQRKLANEKSLVTLLTSGLSTANGGNRGRQNTSRSKVWRPR